MKIQKLTPEQLLQTIQNGEFDTQLLCAKEYTVVLMSQSWCPQFLMVRRMIEKLPEMESVQVLETVYDKDPAGKEFMTFKEAVFQNHLIPYLRFYKNGALRKETNYISKGAFLQHIEQS